LTQILYSVTSAPLAIQTQKFLQEAVEDEFVPAHLIQIKAAPEEVSFILLALYIV
jgi:hypothetical protein